MSEKFIFNAPQFVDFCSESKDEDAIKAEAYFDEDHEEKSDEALNFKQIDSERDMEEEFLSAEQSPYPMAEMCLRSRLRRSLSSGNVLLTVANDEQPENLREDVNNLHIDEKQKTGKTATDEKTRRSAVSRNSKVIRSRSASRDKLSQPKTGRGSEAYHSVAETVLNFQKGFRAQQNPKQKQFHIHATIPQSPALQTKQRARPIEVISKDDQEKRQLEEAKKYRIKARPVNTKMLHGPVKVQAPVERKPPTTVEPFKITAVSKPVAAPQEVEPFKFQAKPVPKSVYNAPKIPPRSTTPTAFEKVRPLQKHRSLDHVDRVSNTSLNSIETVKPSKTNPMPFSFEERDKHLKKKKEEFIHKLLEDEKKAREFHARPPPKYLQQPTQQQNSRVPVRRTASNGDINKRITNGDAVHSASPPVFKARPATVLYTKPFEPKHEAKPLTEITEFNLNTDRRAKEREAFDEDLKKREERIEQLKKEEEEKLLAEEQKEIALLRKQAEHKANPVRHYKEIVIKKSNKITVPVSPKFNVGSRLQNKENINQGI